MNTRVKYPRTMHLPWSPGLQNDDRRIEDLSVLQACEEVVVTEKRDGENTTLYRDGYHARSLDSKHHESRAWVKQLHGQIQHEIPEEMRICGENLFATHSIHYTNLESFFEVFNIWKGNICLSWDETCEWADLLGLEMVPQLYRGPWNESAIRDQALPETRSAETVENDGQIFSVNAFEGYVVRDAGSFDRDSFGIRSAKWVRAGHVQTDEFWMSRPVFPNRLEVQ